MNENKKENDNPSEHMFSNYNIWKYCSKYFFLIVIGVFTFESSAKFINQKNDVANLIGSALFAGLFTGMVLILIGDVTKFVTGLKNKNENNKENK